MGVERGLIVVLFVEEKPPRVAERAVRQVHSAARLGTRVRGELAEECDGIVFVARLDQVSYGDADHDLAPDSLPMVIGGYDSKHAYPRSDKGSMPVRVVEERAVEELGQGTPSDREYRMTHGTLNLRFSIAPTEEIRAAFPALERIHRGHRVAYFDGPGGTQVPRGVVEAMGDYLLHHNANTHWSFPSSAETDAALLEARRVLADFPERERLRRLYSAPI